MLAVYTSLLGIDASFTHRSPDSELTNLQSGIPEAWGRAAAKAEFGALVGELGAAYAGNRLRAQLARLPEVLRALLPPDGGGLEGEPWEVCPSGVLSVSWSKVCHMLAFALGPILGWAMTG